MAYPTFVAAGTDTNIPGSGGGGSANIPIPAGTLEDDFLMMVVVLGASSGLTVTTPTGFTLLNKADGGLFNGGIYIYWKLAGASEPSTHTLSHNGGNSGQGRIFGWRGVDLTTPINVQDMSASQVGTSAPAGDSVTTTVAECLHLLVGFEWNGRTPTLSANGSATSRGGSTASGLVFLVTEEQIASATTVSGRTITSSLSGDYFVSAIAIAGALVDPVYITIPDLVSNANISHADATGVTVHVFEEDGTFVVTKTGQTVEPTGDLVITDPLFVSTTMYEGFIRLSTGERGTFRVEAST